MVLVGPSGSGKDDGSSDGGRPAHFFQGDRLSVLLLEKARAPWASGG
jgi:hypothetical protein